MYPSCVFRGSKWWICMYIMSRLMVINIRLGHLFAISKVAKSQLFILLFLTGWWSCITLYIGKFLACTDWPMLSWWLLMLWRQICTKSSHTNSAMSAAWYEHWKQTIVNLTTLSSVVDHCHYDNLRCHQWRQSCQIDELLFSVNHITQKWSCTYCIVAIKQTMAGRSTSRRFLCYYQFRFLSVFKRAVSVL